MASRCPSWLELRLGLGLWLGFGLGLGLWLGFGLGFGLGLESGRVALGARYLMHLRGGSARAVG